MKKHKELEKDTIVRRWHYTEPVEPFCFPQQDIVFVCVGTDRSTGDSFGPLMGSALKKAGVPNVYGCISEPVHAVNLERCLDLVSLKHPDALVVGVDAALGKQQRVGMLLLREAPLAPGTGVGKTLPLVGTYSITAIVNVGGFMEYVVLHSTRLAFVFALVESLTTFLLESLAYPISGVAVSQGVGDI